MSTKLSTTGNLPDAFTDDDVMLFGKYKDTPLHAVPAEYLRWLWENGVSSEWNKSSNHGRLARYIYNNRGAIECDVSGVTLEIESLRCGKPGIFPEGNVLVFDTETSGLPNPMQYKNPRHHETPFIAEIGARIYTPDGAVFKEYQTYIKPEGWEMSKTASEKTGITTEFLHKNGVPLNKVMAVFHDFLYNGPNFVARDVVAFNIGFDMLLYEASCLRLGITPILKGLRKHCAMELSTPILKLPSRNSNRGYKWPTLQEAFKFFYGREFNAAHSAVADLHATYAVFCRCYGKEFAA